MRLDPTSDAVIKVGGSLARDMKAMEALCLELSKMANERRIVIVPGGGKFADVARELGEKFQLSETASHWMAILAMNQFGFLLVDLMPGSQAVDELKKAKKAKIPIFLPFKLIFSEDPFEHSWNVTSDSIAAYIASRLRARKLILIKDVDGIFTRDPKKSKKAKLIRAISAKELSQFKEWTCVDPVLPKLLIKHKIDCFVINGKYPERVKAIVEGRSTICTRIGHKA